MAVVGTSYGQGKNRPSLNQLKWLAGTWSQTNVKPGETASESWKLAAQKLIGTAETKKNGKVVFQEKLALIERDGEWYYSAEVTGSKGPVLFKLTEIGPHYFVCENPANDFPKKISYRLSGNQLLATISGDGKKVEFVFVKRS